MLRYERNLWSFLSEKSCFNFNVIERLDLAISLCLEVKKVHEKEITHRDIKPSNIMMDASGGIKLVDFGIGDIISMYGSYGTPGFLAPEQFACDEQTQKVDIWAMGKALIIFEWRSAWKLLWSPKFLTPGEIRSLGPLSKIIDLVKEMVKVNYLIVINNRHMKKNILFMNNIIVNYIKKFSRLMQKSASN